MENEKYNPWINTLGARIIIDYWTDHEFSYSLILYPDNSLHFIWLNLNK